MRKLIIIVALLTSFSGFSQRVYFELLFNEIGPMETSLGYEYRLKDIMEADSVTCNAEFWDIKEFWCSSVCQIDWEYHVKGNRLSSDVKHFIKNCNTHDKKKLYFNKIVLEDPTGRRVVIDEFVVVVRM